MKGEEGYIILFKIQPLLGITAPTYENVLKITYVLMRVQVPTPLGNQRICSQRDMWWIYSKN